MLSPGDKLGRYEVISPLGAGGMGEVYRARDAELQREVALKILPEALSSDPDRLRRFEREAKVTAALSHPNVLTVFDVGHEAGRAYLVLEMLEGSTLAEVMKDGALRTREALDYAAQVARGLAAVHAHGIVHRDLKPANLCLTTTGVVKILDFGLARIGAAGFQSAEETTAEVTGAGLVLGTVSYMSPEQARGDPPDARSDLFSLGTVLYEMLSGRHPFRRNSSAETATAILRDTPADPGRLESPAAGAIKRLVGRCLEKRPEDRFQTANDLALALDVLRGSEDWVGPAFAADPMTQTSAPARREPTKAAPRARRWIASGIAASAALVLSAVAWQSRRGREAPLPPPRLVPLTSTRGSERWPTFSPDGEQVAFQWGGEKSDNEDIYVKMVGSSEVHRLTTDPAADTMPSWSPDGRQIAFVRSSASGAGAIHLVSSLGGPDRKLSDLPVESGPLSWSGDGRRLAMASLSLPANGTPSNLKGIRLVGVPGGETIAATSPSAATYHTNPTFSPDGHSLAYASCVGGLACHIEIIALGPDYVPRAVPRRLTRKAVLLQALAWVPDGKSLVYAAGQPARLWRLGIAGDQVPEVIEVAGYIVNWTMIAVSRSRLAFQLSLYNTDIYRLEEGHPPEAVASSNLWEQNPQFSPDGRRFAFESTRSGETTDIWVAAADGSSPTQLTHGLGLSQGSARWSPDGRRIAFDSFAEDGHWSIWTIDADGGGLRRLTSDPADENMPSWSRDGRFVYFTSNRTGASTSVWRIPAAGGPEERVTQTGGGAAFESVDGKALFFTRDMAGPSPLLAVSLGGGPERTVIDCVRRWGFAIGTAGIYHLGCGPDGPALPVPVYLRDLSTGHDRLLGTMENWRPGFTVSPDGKTILYTKVVGEGSDLMLIENFR
jgi:Tol biopolymer transport system component/serine/threonine protein kinase